MEQEKLDPVYEKHLIVCSKVSGVWSDIWELGTDEWDKRGRRE